MSFSLYEYVRSVVALTPLDSFIIYQVLEAIFSEKLDYFIFLCLELPSALVIGIKSVETLAAEALVSSRNLAIPALDLVNIYHTRLLMSITRQCLCLRGEVEI